MTTSTRTTITKSPTTMAARTMTARDTTTLRMRQSQLLLMLRPPAAAPLGEREGEPDQYCEEALLTAPVEVLRLLPSQSARTLTGGLYRNSRPKKQLCPISRRSLQTRDGTSKQPHLLSPRLEDERREQLLLGRHTFASSNPPSLNQPAS